MSKILGIAAPFGHDPSAAILIDGEIVAACEEERFIRKKHATGVMPVNAVNFCLKHSGVKPREIDYIAYPWSPEALRKKRSEYLRRTIFSHPSRAYKKFFCNRKETKGQSAFIEDTLKNCGFEKNRPKIEWVEHHLAHTASSFFLSGFEKAAVLSIDSGGEITSTLLGVGQERTIKSIKEIVAPDSLGNFYATMTDYLGFRRENGEYKVMGMAPYGDPEKINFDHIIWWNDKNKSFRCNDDYIWVRRNKRFCIEKIYSKKMVQEFGPERNGDDLSEPYIHIAAVTQKKLEGLTLKLIDSYLKENLKKHGRLCFSGGCALNVALNRVLLEYPYIKNLWVQPASGDAGTSLGAAVYLAARLGEKIEPMRHIYLGPEYSNKEIETEIKKSGFSFSYEENICEVAAELLYKGHIVGWFQGRMEWGPRALGNRSILGNPTIRGTADKINALIKFREKWRPFCPSILKEFAPDILNSVHPAPFMTIGFKVSPKWKRRIPEVIHVNGTCRPQVVEEETNPKFYRLIKSFYSRRGVPVVINTSLNRRGEPMVCSPRDALVMFKESGLDYLAIGDFLVKKGTHNA
ncbi:MAG: carbamoyltransferase [Candidatus Omnitrophota bacterium]|nr:MAG: carbamoyltransferase [Candidatus Omnitrophota bacterium]